MLIVLILSKNYFKLKAKICFENKSSIYLVITLCCFIKLRLPRTKSEINANAKRKELLKNFKAKLKSLKSADLDDMDYRLGRDSSLISMASWFLYNVT